jgi:hypothetical protein
MIGQLAGDNDTGGAALQLDQPLRDKRGKALVGFLTHETRVLAGAVDIDRPEGQRITLDNEVS